MCPNNRFDYILAGGGAAGLSLAWYISQSEILKNKRVLIIDRDDKNRNDRTWGFWSNDFTVFDEILFRQFHQLEFVSSTFHKVFEMAPYSYKVIRGIDFYHYIRSNLQGQSNFSFLKADIQKVDVENGQAVITTSEGDFSAEYIFSSIFHEPEIMQKAKKNIYLRQHFKGWIIKSDQSAFNPDQITLFDFRTPQNDQMRFFYLIPQSSDRGLVEFTLFTENLLKPLEYDEGLKTYIRNILKVESYEIEETEFGVIPMTNYRFPAHFRHKLIYTGSAGGSSKPSSGYTFLRIQKHVQKMVKALEKDKSPVISATSPVRYMFYDSVLLNILKNRGHLAEFVFTILFKNNSLSSIFQFLDEEGGLANDLKVTLSLPKWPFLKATARTFFG